MESETEGNGRGRNYQNSGYFYRLYNQSSFDITLIDRCGFELKFSTCQIRPMRKKLKKKHKKHLIF